MAEAIITRRGGVGFPEGWNESVSAPAFGSITKHEPVMFRVFCGWGGEEVKLSDPSTLPASNGWGCAFSPDGAYLAVVHYIPPYITIYKRSGDTFTKLANPSTLPASNGWGCAFSPVGAYLAVAHSLPPYITIYKHSGDTFTKLADPSTLPAGIGRGCAFSPDGAYLAVAHQNSPYITIYNTDTYDVIQQMTSRSMFLLTGKHGLSLTTANDGETARAIVFPSVYNLPRE